MKQSSQYAVDFNGPFLGLNTASAPHMLGPGFAREAENVIISRGGAIKPRTPWRSYYQLAAPNDWVERIVVGMLHLDVSKLVGWTGGSPAVRVFAKVLHQGHPTSGSIDVLMSTVTKSQLGGWDFSKLPPTWVFAQGRLFIIDGGGPSNPSLWQYDGDKVFSLGIPVPILTTQIELIEEVGAGPEEGTYLYGVTFYDSVYGRESNPLLFSDEGEPFSLTGTNRYSVVIHGGAIQEAPYHFDRIRIYRRHVADADGNDVTWDDNGITRSDPYRLIGEYAFESGEDDEWDAEVSDDDVTLSDLATGPFMPTRNGIPPNARVAAYYKARMWYADPDDGTKLWYSEIDQPDHVYSLAFVRPGGDADDIITGLVEMAGQLIILKKESIWILSGDLETYNNDSVALGKIPGIDFFEQFPELYKSKSKTGCHNAGGGNGAIVCGHPPLLYYSRADGLYVFDGVDDRPVSDLVSSEWMEMLAAVNTISETDHAMTYAVDVANQVLYCCPSVATAKWETFSYQPGDPGTQTIMAYHWARNRGDGVGVWTIIRPEPTAYESIGCIASCLGKPYRYTEEYRERIEQQSDLLVAVMSRRDPPDGLWYETRIKYGDPSDATLHMPFWKWRTGDLPVMGGKRSHVYYLEQRHALGTALVRIDVSLDGGSMFLLSSNGIGEDAATAIVRRKRVGRTARTMSLRFGRDPDSVMLAFLPWDGITGFALDVELAEQR